MFGDLNYRVDLEYNEAVQRSNTFTKKDQTELKEKDQLILILAEQKHFPLLREQFIGFRPTYKYNPGSDIYDTSKKQRVPAWCDRVLYWENEQ